MKSKYKMLSNVAYVCQGLAWIGVLLWIINAIIFFYTFFSSGPGISTVKDIIANYGGGIIAAIIPILLLYATGGLIYLFLDIEQNTRKS
ncbi:MAG: hypothetical protein KKF20_00025 [Bacteroidetes bacterium]|nr:hypothetical protein [Bacteroidota bacterium]MBU1422975.1 hypothetical protein [Bacteroidota bacterium]MBU2470781.1 hypothetical protein [Bacteroidota bacterium]MBU2636165.1 hypothetical protein [Bacteroidota bacterium]MDI6779918.1 hypothetical protein [Bacteroidota bacterium]